jgi:hypothetical protein
MKNLTRPNHRPIPGDIAEAWLLHVRGETVILPSRSAAEKCAVRHGVSMTRCDLTPREVYPHPDSMPDGWPPS